MIYAIYKDPESNYRKKECHTTEEAFSYLLQTECLPIAVVDNSLFVQIVNVNNMHYDPMSLFYAAMTALRLSGQPLPGGVYSYDTQLKSMQKTNCPFTY